MQHQAREVRRRVASNREEKRKRSLSGQRGDREKV